MSPLPPAVVGGSGFIGSRLAATLAERGSPPIVIDIRRPKGEAIAGWVDCDILDVETLTSGLAGVGTVFNLVGAHGVVDHPPAVYRSVNVDGARALCRAAEAAEVEHIVFVSTAAVYGDTDAPDEGRACRPTGGYGTSKLEAEGIHREWADGHDDRRLGVVRPAVVFGPGDDGAGDRLLRYAAQPDLVLPGPADNRKSMAFVENLAAFLCFIADRPDAYSLFNYCDAPDMTLAEIVGAVRQTLGLPPAEIAPTATPGLLARLRATLAGTAAGREPGHRAAREIVFDAQRARGAGFVQPTSLGDALALTAEAELGWMKLKARASE